MPSRHRRSEPSPHGEERRSAGKFTQLAQAWRCGASRTMKPRKSSGGRPSFETPSLCSGSSGRDRWVVQPLTSMVAVRPFPDFRIQRLEETFRILAFGQMVDEAVPELLPVLILP